VTIRCSRAYSGRAGRGRFRRWPNATAVPGDRTTERLRHEAMAKNGIVSIALDFRSGNEEPYPSSVQDINYAVRWAKLNVVAELVMHQRLRK
jgi:hypothetical protein